MELDLKRRIDDLSYGNKKKVGIVQGLLHSPKLIFLDEPTAGLDPLMQHKFFDLMREENKRGATVFFSSHILGEVQSMCNRVAIIKEGRIIDIEDMQHPAEEQLQEGQCHRRRAGPETCFKLEGRQRPGAPRTARSASSTRATSTTSPHIVAGQKVSDLTIEDPTLEEIFMHYYE